MEHDDNRICLKFCLLLFSPVTDTVVVRGVGVVTCQEVGGGEMGLITANFIQEKENAIYVLT